MPNVEVHGVTMDQLARTARCNGCAVRILRNLTVQEATRLLKSSVRGRPDSSFEFVLVSYDRRTLDQTGSGHFSPIAAVDETTSSVLILDVARFKVRPIPLLNSSFAFHTTFN